MIQRFFRFLTFATLSIFALSARAQSSDSNEQEQVHDELMNAIVRQPGYQGFYHNVQKSSGLFCDNIQESSVQWGAKLGNVDLEFGDGGSADFHTNFGVSYAEVGGWRQGGFLCLWTGGTGRVSVQQTDVDFSLFPVKPGENPRIEIRGARIHGLKIDQINLALGFTISDAGAPGWMNSWIEGSFNQLMQSFLASGFKSRLDNYISQKVKDFLDKLQAKPNGSGLESQDAPVALL